MPAPHIFALPYAPFDDVDDQFAEDGPGFRKKRRRKADVDGDAEDPGNDTTPLGPALNKAASQSLAYTSLTADQHEQIRTAGLQPGENIPGAPFPHVYPKTREYVFREVKKELAELKPPLAHLDPDYYMPQRYKTNKDHTTLKEQHLAVLTTLLHQMLQKRDYERAARAWGLLLRSGALSRHKNTKSGLMGMDVRAHERWGIGAELLMRSATASGGPGEFSEEGFRMARQYYERLIVQYPHNPQRRGAEASDFYAAMFSIWIFEISRKYANTTGLEEDEESDARSPSPEAETEVSDGDSMYSSSFNRRTRRQLRDAKAISSRLTEVLEIPQYDRIGELLQMRGMVELWVTDLEDEASVPEEKKTANHVDAARFFQRAVKYGIELPLPAQKILDEHADDLMSGDEKDMESSAEEESDAEAAQDSDAESSSDDEPRDEKKKTAKQKATNAAKKSSEEGSDDTDDSDD